jgi:RND family efflux transporter MFP subunit
VPVVGTLYGYEVVTITPKVEGRVSALNVEVGDRVAPGEILLELDPADYVLAVDEAKRSLELELSRLDLTELPGPDFDIEQLPAVERARLVVENAKRQFQREEELRRSNVSTAQIYEQVQTDLKIAEASLRQARVDAHATLATVRHREAVLALARQRLEDTRVQAPAAPKLPTTSTTQPKFVVSQRMVSIGELVRAFPSTPVFELVMDDVLKLRVLVPERFLPLVVTGLAVEVHVDAYPNEAFPATVARVNPTVDMQNRSFEVEVHVPNADHRLRHGNFAKGEAIAGESISANTVPVEAVSRFAGVSKVFCVRDGQAAEVEVTLGAAGEGWVEVIGNKLTAEDVVVTSGQGQLVDGTPVKVRESAVVAANPD